MYLIVTIMRNVSIMVDQYTINKFYDVCNSNRHSELQVLQ